MKKKIIWGVICFLVLMTLTGCNDKKAISTEEFREIAGEKGMLVVDVTDQIEGAEGLKEAVIAVNNGGWQVEFYVFENDITTDKVFEHNKDIFMQSKTSSSIELSSSTKNFSNYSLKSNGHYMYITRINNTFLYLDVVESYEDAAKDFVKKMGY